MDEIYTAAIAEMGISLATLAVKGTATAINTKIRSIKNERDTEKLRTIYDEMINELLSEREEAIRIAQTYKAELDKIVISDEDIKHLHQTVSLILGLVEISQIAAVANKSEEEKEKVKAQHKSLEQMKELISVDTLKTMQLLGFNYKAAIGDPLTQICANAISSFGNKNKNNKK